MLKALVFAIAILTPSTDWMFLPSLAKQVVRIEVLEADGKGVCSGVVLSIEKGTVLTAGHCSSPDAEYTVNGRHARLVRRNSLLDLAVLAFTPKGEEAVTFAAAPAKQGEPVAILGFPFGDKEFQFQVGIVSLAQDGDGFVHVDANIAPGDSGGGLFNAKGELVGINVAVRLAAGGASHQALAVQLETIRDFVYGLR